MTKKFLRQASTWAIKNLSLIYVFVTVVFYSMPGFSQAEFPEYHLGDLVYIEIKLKGTPRPEEKEVFIISEKYLNFNDAKYRDKPVNEEGIRDRIVDKNISINAQLNNLKFTGELDCEDETPLLTVHRDWAPEVRKAENKNGVWYDYSWGDSKNFSVSMATETCLAIKRDIVENFPLKECHYIALNATVNHVYPVKHQFYNDPNLPVFTMMTPELTQLKSRNSYKLEYESHEVHCDS